MLGMRCVSVYDVVVGLHLVNVSRMAAQPRDAWPRSLL